MSSTTIFPSSGGGRGRVIEKVSNLRRPGHFEPKKMSGQFESKHILSQVETRQSPNSYEAKVPCSPLETKEHPEHIKQIETLLSELTLSSVEDKTMYTLVGKVRINCDTAQDVELLSELVYKYCLRNKENAEIGATLSGMLSDFEADGKKFRTELLRKIQHDYEEREKAFSECEKFVMNTKLLCELFEHLRMPNGDGLLCLIQPMAVYFEMLLRNGTDAEIEVFVEQMQKYHKLLKENQPEAYEKILLKMRAKIISAASEFVRVCLLELFEIILTNGASMKPKAAELYELSKRKAKVID